MHRTPNQNVTSIFTAGIFGPLARKTNHKIHNLVKTAERRSVSTLKKKLKPLQQPQQNNPNSFGLGYRNYNLTIFAQRPTSSAKTPTPEKQEGNNVIPLPCMSRGG